MQTFLYFSNFLTVCCLTFPRQPTWDVQPWIFLSLILSVSLFLSPFSLASLWLFTHIPWSMGRGGRFLHYLGPRHPWRMCSPSDSLDRHLHKMKLSPANTGNLSRHNLSILHANKVWELLIRSEDGKEKRKKAINDGEMGRENLHLLQL